MYYLDSFSHLTWNAIEAFHETYWKSIFMRGVILNANERFPDLLTAPHSVDKNSTPSLDMLASACVDTCSDILFRFPMPGYETQSLANKQWLQQYFKDALCDHLILTFSYRFCCDNLSNVSLRDSCGQLLRANPEFQRQYSGLGLRNRRREKVKDNYKGYEAKYQKLLQGLTISPQGEETNNPVSSKATIADIIIQNIQCKSLFNTDLCLIKEKISPSSLPLPGIWANLFLIKNWEKVLNIVTSKSPYSKLCELLKSADITAALARHNGKLHYVTANVNGSKLCESDCNNCFVAVPISTSSTYITPQLSTTMTGHPNKNVSFTKETQTLFCNYLLEKNLHIHALSTAIHLIDSMTSLNQSASVNLAGILPIFCLHSPLLQSQYLNLLYHIPHPFNHRTLITSSISYWNSYALPVLEELFIWSIKIKYPCAEDILNAVLKCLEPTQLGGSRYDRLNLYRLVDNSESVEQYNSNAAITQNVLQGLIRSAFIGPLLSMYGEGQA